MESSSWRFWIDVGGTFTDCLALGSDSMVRSIKVLSSSVIRGIIWGESSSIRIVDKSRAGERENLWAGYRVRLVDAQGMIVDEATVRHSSSDSGALDLSNPVKLDNAVAYEVASDEPAPLLAIRSQLGIRRDEPLPPLDIRLGTTRGTNALLTRTGAPTALFITKGFRDALQIGYQNRPHLFQLNVEKIPPLYETVVEIDERVSADGVILRELDEETCCRQMGELLEGRIRSCAICLLHGDRFPSHEAALGRIAKSLGFEHVSLSHRVSPLIKLISRAETTVLDAYITPILQDYVDRIRDALHPASRLKLMTSSGGLIAAESFSGKDSLLSGPAGGVVGFSRMSRRVGMMPSIGFDMGGTSTDVSRFDGQFELEYESSKAGIRVNTPQLAIETVAAGGGSICHYDGSRFLVGPASATSDPGPACYGRGGPLTVTDVNLFLGRIIASRFPWKLDSHAVEIRLDEIRAEVSAASGLSMTRVQVAEGFLRVANLSMSSAIRTISVARGYDPRGYTLCAFGGAAPQHVCAVADELEINRILIHPLAGVLSALGIGLADLSRHVTRGIYQSVDELTQSRIDDEFMALERQAAEELSRDGASRDSITYRRTCQMRYEGTDSTLNIADSNVEHLQASFEKEHRRRFGYQQDRRGEVVALRVEAISASGDPAIHQAPTDNASTHDVESIRMIHNGVDMHARLILGDQLQAGATITGPAIIADRLSTTVIEPCWSADKLPDGQLRLQRKERVTADHAVSDHATQDRLRPGVSNSESPDFVDPILLEVFNNHFQEIATDMGEVLRQTATSVNVKERLDFSCALFTHAGNLVVNAPHIPVHLGAMGETVKSIVAEFEELAPNDVIVTNDPYKGGSHLPDITVVSPVFVDGQASPTFFAASRAHHAEIGGKTPGSMPPDSTTLGEEGVLISNFKLIENGVSHFDRLVALLTSGVFPSRSPEENVADIQAQIAANHRGAESLQRLVERYGLTTVRDYMEYIQDAAEAKVRDAISRLSMSDGAFEDRLDDGAQIRVSLHRSGESLLVDFTGTANVHPGNLNANRSIVVAAVLYCLRCIVDQDIPLNEGLLAPVELVLPECMLNPPRRDDPMKCAAMVGGNVETSQRIVDVLLGALQLAAASQGTMNNFLFGNDEFGYYETICGGVGATAQGPGADAVHSHMTNTRLTDPEILESRFPVRLHRFEIRHGSGGVGFHRGGHGVIREIEFLQPLRMTTLCQRRGEVAPFGLAGGGEGRPGCNTLSINASKETLPGLASKDVLPNHRIVIETPGGGAWGSKEQGEEKREEKREDDSSPEMPSA